MMGIETANAEQRLASDPATSAFVAASAGSGKTKLLTDRLLRLMLTGTRPDRILCLTYTKAAAAEMMLRLNARLGAWVVQPEAKLAAELSALDIVPTGASLMRARKLFAEVLDLPGGMRIGTIHAFCQSLLRRFPLEAELSPHFEVDEDAAFLPRLREAREAVLADIFSRAPVAALAAETNEQDFAALTAQLAARPEIFEQPAERIIAQQRAALGTEARLEQAILETAARWAEEGDVTAACRRLLEAGNKTGRSYAERVLPWLECTLEHRIRRWAEYRDAHYTTGGALSAITRFCGPKLRAEQAALEACIAAEQQRIERVEEALRAARLAVFNAHLVSLAQPILGRERDQKNLAARLGYGDLISRTGRLLADPGAAWILYKLDGGIEHLLLDEVQDTAPAQWEIAHAIAAEFFAGAGARESPRTVFAVGDAKQSIFSFQGADLQSFEAYRQKFRARVQGAGAGWVDGKLSVSFRATAPVLELVDAVFAGGPARDGVCAGAEVLEHRLSRTGQAGAVTLWPPSLGEVPAPPPDWAPAATYTGAKSAKTVLAGQIAAYVSARLAQDLPSRGRKARPGDFLVLVRRRDALVPAITAALKSHGIPVAGLDRMMLMAQPAVSDLLALCNALLLPEDDLAFATYLASPLGGLSDDSLMALALHRRGRLFETLLRRGDERADWRATRAFYLDLRGKTDFLAPHALLGEALGPLGGRARLLARLGAEAAEPLDEFLAEALKFCRAEPGSLQLFVEKIRQSASTIKREAEAAGDEVRIMTVHGAKGLQAPIVILPDTTTLPDARNTLLWLDVPQQPGVQVPIFCARKNLRCESVSSAFQVRRDAALQEYNRLLYVALTRAEDEILVCGAQGGKAIPEASWYAAVRDGFARLGAEPRDGIAEWRTGQTAPPDRQKAQLAVEVPELPSWAGAAPDWRAAVLAPEATRPEKLAPSRAVEEDAKRAIAASPLGDGLAALRGARAAAMNKGRVVHALLQHLPDIAPVQHLTAARKFLEGQPELADQAAKIISDVLAILALPALAPLFAPGARAEVPLAGVVGEVEIGGLVDRLAVTPDEVLIADYKTDRQPPVNPQNIPEKYLAQLSAYKTILAQIYPARAVTCLLIWTETAAVMPVPPAMLARYAPA